MHTLELTQVGNSVGIVLPEEVLTRLKLKKGARVFVTETPDGIALTRYDEELDAQLSAGRELMRQYHQTFAQLAK
jgi:putative addiction module antidote